MLKWLKYLTISNVFQILFMNELILLLLFVFIYLFDLYHYTIHRSFCLFTTERVVLHIIGFTKIIIRQTYLSLLRYGIYVSNKRYSREKQWFS